MSFSIKSEKQAEVLWKFKKSPVLRPTVGFPTWLRLLKKPLHATKVGEPPLPAIDKPELLCKLP